MAVAVDQIVYYHFHMIPLATDCCGLNGCLVDWLCSKRMDRPLPLARHWGCVCGEKQKKKKVKAVHSQEFSLNLHNPLGGPIHLLLIRGDPTVVSPVVGEGTLFEHVLKIHYEV